MQWLRLFTLISADGVQFPAKLQFYHCLFKQGLITVFMCSDQHVKNRMPRGFPLTSSLLLDYHVKQYIHVHTHVHTLNGIFRVLAHSHIALMFFLNNTSFSGQFTIWYKSVLPAYKLQYMIACLVGQ